MRNTSPIRFVLGAGYGVGPVAPRQRITRVHPRRDESGHGGEGGKTPPGQDGETPPADETPEQKAVREAQEQVAKTKSVSEWLVAEAQHKAEQARQAGLSEEQRASETQFQTAVATAVEEKKLEIAAEYIGQIDNLQNQLVDALIGGTLGAKGLEVKQFETVLGKLDKAAFIGEDGAVNVADVTKFADELAGAATKRPPRTGGPRVSGDDRGFGKYLPQKNN